VRLLDHPRDLAVLGPIAEKEIVWRLLCSEQGPRLRQIGLADSRLSQIGRAMRWMREHYREALSIEELAHLSAMSVTSFHRHFRAVALMSPLQYLKQIRLQEARTRLLGRAEDIATVGHAVGYDSPSQFSREYKRAYGSPRAKTLACCAKRTARVEREASGLAECPQEPSQTRKYHFVHKLHFARETPPRYEPPAPKPRSAPRRTETATRRSALTRVTLESSVEVVPLL
jgi:AraC-like DNA-binding protein